MSDADAERQPGLDMMQMDATLKSRQIVGATPRTLAIRPATVGTGAGLLAGLVGHRIGSTRPARIIIDMLPAHAAGSRRAGPVRVRPMLPQVSP